MSWFRVLKYDNLLLFLVVHYSKFDISVYWTVSQTKQGT